MIFENCILLTLFNICSDLHLYFGIKSNLLAACQAQYCLTKMSRGLLDRTAFVDQSRNSDVKMKATFATRTGSEMLLHNRDFLGTEFPVNIEVKTSNSLITIHN